MTTRLPRYIDTADELSAFCAELADAPWIALDTEFIRERTYYPKFCLLQIASGTHAACIDPLAVTDLSPLHPLLLEATVVKVFHAARQDLEILYRLLGRVPEPLFDTQVAAPFIGLPEQAGYATLVQELLNISLDKAHSRTDWASRPLSAEQLGYAADDVIYLGEIYCLLKERLSRLGRLEWAIEEMRGLSDAGLYAPSASDAWQRIGGTAQLSRTQLQRLRALAAWREDTARTQDCPRGWLIRDDVLVDIARRGPSNTADLARIRALDERSVKRHGNRLLEVLADAARPDDAGPSPPPSRPPESPATEAVLDVFSALVKLRASEESLNPSVLAGRRDLREFLEQPDRSRLTQGWRNHVIGEDLLAMLRGRKQLAVVDGRLKVTSGV